MGLRKNYLKNRSRRWSLKLVSWTLVFAMLGGQAFGLTANVRIEGPSNTTIFSGNVTVPQSVTVNGETINGYKEINALVAASKAGGFPISLSKGTYGWSLDSINNISDPNWMKYWNQRVNWENSMVGIGDKVINQGDRLLIHYTGFDPQTYAVEMPLRLSISKSTVDLNERFTLRAEYYDDTDNTFKPISADIYVGSTKYTASSNGAVSARLTRNGSFNIYALKAGHVKSNQITVKTNQAYRINNAVNQSVGFLRSRQTKSGGIENPVTTAWSAIAFSANDLDLNKIKRWNGKPIHAYLKTCKLYNASDYSRQILAVMSGRGNPRKFGGNNYVAKLASYYKNGEMGDKYLLNDDIFAIVALVGAKTNNRSLVQSMLNNVVNHQHEDGGISYSEQINKSDVDMTAAMVQALVAARNQGYQNLDEPIDEAIAFIKSKQNSDGGFGSVMAAENKSNSASTSWAIQAFKAARKVIDGDGSYLNNPSGNTPYTYLLSVKCSDGSFSYDSDGDTPRSVRALMTAYAMPALLGKPWPVRRR